MRTVWQSLSAAVIFAAIFGAWTATKKADGQSADPSPYKGRIVRDPEGSSGLWETSNGRDGFVGIHIVLGTTVAPDAKSDGRTLKGVEQRSELISLGVYEQKGEDIAFGEENQFSDTPQGGGVVFEGGHLQLHFVPRFAAEPAFDLDLRKEEGDRWKGRFHRGSFDKEVILERPGTALKLRDEVAGSWNTEGRPPVRVVHVGEQSKGHYAGWGDMLQIPGTVGFAPWIAPHRLYEIYGERVRVERVGKTGISFEFGTYSGICCQHMEVGTLSADGRAIRSKDRNSQDWLKRRD